MARIKKDNHKTAEIILESAQKHFLLKGFDGTSINDVAGDAKINKSLIYHHFGSKENLWKTVKESIVKKVLPDDSIPINFKQTTLKEFLKTFLTFRFQLYSNHPELIRLMAWQRLDSKIETLSGVNLEPYTSLESHIGTLQSMGEIRSDLEPEVVTYLLMSLSSNAFVDNASFVQSKKGQEQYLKLLNEGLMQILSPKA